MIKAEPLAALALAVLTATGCGYGVLQTAHTEPPGKISGTLGLSHVNNELSGSAGRGFTTNTGGDLEPRMGITEQLDVGVAPWFALGGRADAKLNLLAWREPFALAPHLGGGAAKTDDGSVVMANAGVITSYRIGVVEPYFDATFADHWISQRETEPVQLLPGERKVSRSYTGDGLVKLTLGLDIRTRVGDDLLLEYSRWMPLLNDEGDNYAFVTSNVISFGWRFGPKRP